MEGDNGDDLTNGQAAGQSVVSAMKKKNLDPYDRSLQIAPLQLDSHMEIPGVSADLRQSRQGLP